MAIKSRSSSVWHMLHFFIRWLGLTAVVTAIAGGFVWSVLERETVGLAIIAVSLAVFALALLFELRSIGEVVSSSRGAFGFNVLLQIVLIIALVAGANVYSFQNYVRFDLTREKIFTLPEDIREQLSKLRGETEIIVFQQYVSFGQRAENKQDKYDFAAQRKIVEKVKDLAEQFQDLGPRFHVRILDIQDEQYQRRIDDIRTHVAKDLAETIEKAPENSIFFYSKDQKQTQRLSFSDVFQLDKQSSVANHNLVLKYQGAEPFARKVFNIEEKKPHVAVAVIHPVLGFQNQEMPMFTMSGAKKVLDAYGFDCTDIMLRKLDNDGDLTEEPTVLSYDESRYEQIVDELVETDVSLKQLQKELDETNELYQFWSDSPLSKLNTKYVYFILEDGRQGIMARTQIAGLKKSGIQHKLIDVDEEDRKGRITAYKHNSEVIKHILDSQREERDSLVKEKATLKVDNLAEKRRLTDLEAKAKAMLANVDLLILPRITLLNAPSNRVIANRVHRLDVAQLNAVKAYLKEGKPVLFLLGPTNEPREAPDPGPKDQLEGMLAEIGFVLPRQTILYNIESKEYNERKIGVAFGKAKREIDVPGLKFDDITQTWNFGKKKETFVPNPIRSSLKLMSRSTGNKDSLEVRVRHPRPVYYLSTTLPAEGVASLVGELALPGLAGSLEAATIWINKAQQKPDEHSVFLVTREESWNEENPFIVKNKVPRYTPSMEDDPKKGTVEEERRGPFPIGAAVETTLPSSWVKDGEAPPRVRVAVIGSGGIFVGQTLPPLKEKMFLDTVNWLMGRDDLLARDVETWEFPRVSMSNIEFNCWVWMCYGLPVVFVYLGMVVWMVRRMR